ncbi:MAG: hypothetical protein KIT39_04865 [Nitrospirales bacterium]|nr:hypothetical protein [Nitrospirales bacterium]
MSRISQATFGEMRLVLVLVDGFQINNWIQRNFIARNYRLAKGGVRTSYFAKTVTLLIIGAKRGNVDEALDVLASLM